MIHSQWSWVLASWENPRYSVCLIIKFEFVLLLQFSHSKFQSTSIIRTVITDRTVVIMVIVFLPLMSQVNFSYINNITLFCRKHSSWTSKTVGWQVRARHQMAHICREFDQRGKTGCQETSESGFAICRARSSAFLFAECKYIRTCVWLTARTKVHFCRSDAFSAELIKIQWPVDRQTVPSVPEESAVSMIRVVQEECTEFLGLPMNL